MKNHIFFTLFFLIINSGVNSQFMQNGGFEQYNNLYGGEDLNRADFWHTMLNSPDLKHSQLTFQNIGNSGNGCAYIGLNTVNNSEYCYGTTLGLNANNKYILTFYVKRGNSILNNSIPIGIKIVKNEPISNPYGNTDFSIVQSFVNNPINSPDFTYKPIGNGFEKVTYCFTPTESGIHYVIFGPFLSQTPPFFEGNSFLIDDVDITLATNNQLNLDSNPILASTALCTQNTVLVDGTSSQFENEYQWEIFRINNNQTSLVYTGSVQQGTAGVFNVSDAFSSVGHIPLPNNCYRVILRVLNGCIDIDQVDFCYENVNVDFLNVPAAVCEGTPTDISVTGDDNWTYTWSNGDSGVGMKTTSITPVFPSSQYTVTVTSPSGCSQVNTITLNVHSNNNLAPWMNGIQNLSNGTLGSDPYTVYVQQGQMLSFNSQLFNDNTNENLQNTYVSNITSSFFNLSYPINGIGNLTVFWNTGQGFAPNVSPGIYEFTLTSNDGNQCNLGEESFTYRIIVFCDQCPTCVSFENRIPSNSPLPPETKVGVCIEAGISQPVQTGNANVLFQAGASITLGEFFQAGPGFEALIEPTTCVADCEDCCDDWAGFTFNTVQTFMTHDENGQYYDVFQITDVDHPFCAFGAQGFEFNIYKQCCDDTPDFTLTSFSNSCCPFESPAPENPIPHSSIWWDGYFTTNFGTSYRADDDEYNWTLKLYGCGGQSTEYQGVFYILGVWPGIAPSTSNSENVEENDRNLESISEVSELQNGINLMPNPTRDYIEIVGINSDSLNLFKVHDDKGLEVLSNCKFKNNKLDVSSLSPGTYFVSFMLQDYKLVKKFIKL